MIVGCCGTFDYKIHPGHIKFLEFCKTFGDVIVFLVPDSVVYLNKQRLPYYTQGRRKINLEDTRLIYKVVNLSNRYDQEFICDYGLDYYVFGPDQDSYWNNELCKKLVNHNVKVIHCTIKKEYSTTKLLNEAGLIRELRN